MGALANRRGMRFEFIVPPLCFAVIMIYGFSRKYPFARDVGNTSKTATIPAH